ncbi:hypothetical protein ACQPZJ_44540 [Actinoplanes sp. CA-054009]
MAAVTAACAAAAAVVWRTHHHRLQQVPAPAPPADYVTAALQALPEAGADATLAMAPQDRHRHQGHRGVILRAVDVLEIRDEPRGVAFARLSGTNDGQPVFLPVIAQQPGWLQALLPGRIIGATGWLDADRVQTHLNPYEIRVSLRSGHLSLMLSGRVTRTWKIEPAGTGGLPLGRTFLLATNHDAAHPRRPVLHLAAHTTDLINPVTATITSPDGSGCLLVSASALPALVRTPLGTLVRVHA